jgi:histidinol-phosphate aminotransferase
MNPGKAALTRREWLTAGGVALRGAVLSAVDSAAANAADGFAPPLRARLSLDENPLGPSPLALQAINEQLGDVARYTGGEADMLRQAIAAREGVPADQIVLGEILEVLGLHLAMNGAPGGEFIYSEPGYTALVDAVTPGGGVVVSVPLDPQLRNDLAAIADRMNARTRAIYLVNPHNPTGTVSETAAFSAFVRDVSRRATVIVDEAYLEFEPDFAQRTVAGLTRAGENVVVFRTFTKIYGLAGLAIGYALAPRPLAASLTRNGIGNPRTLNRLAVAAAAGSLRDTSYVATIRAKVTAEREEWNRLFEQLKLRHADSRGNFVFFETGRPHHEVMAALRAKGVEVGRAFPPFDRWVRISIGLPEENAMARAAVAELLR